MYNKVEINDRISIVFDNKDDCDKWCSIEYDHWWWISVWWKAKRENEKMVTINKIRDDQTFYEYLYCQIQYLFYLLCYPLLI